MDPLLKTVEKFELEKARDLWLDNRDFQAVLKYAGKLPTDPDWFDKLWPFILIYGKSASSQLAILAASKNVVIAGVIKLLASAIGYMSNRYGIEQKDLKIK